jgi:purine-binding chemotaxis protein CheW
MTAFTTLESNALRDASRTQVAAAGEYLSFRLGAEEYGIDILRVQEIRSFEEPTRIAGAPECVCGVVNLRGTIVPIVDLRKFFGIEARHDAATVTVVVNTQQRTVGVVVDSVSDVVALGPDQIRAVPGFNATIDTTHLNGIGSVRQGEQERMLILMNIEQLLLQADVGLSD